MKTKLFFIFFALLFFCFENFSCAKGNKNLLVKTLSIKTANGAVANLYAEIADTPQSREMGFMFRKKILDGTGMLFVYQEDSVMSFWMKNTGVPLSIAFIDSRGKIKDIFDMSAYDLNSTTSTGYVRFALEVPQGWFSRMGITEGDFLELDF